MAASKQASFSLREGYKDFSGGTVAVGDGETFDVGGALEKGGGTISVEEDSAEDHALSSYAALKREAKSSKSKSEKES